MIIAATLLCALLGQGRIEAPVFPRTVKPKFDGMVLARIKLNAPVRAAKAGQVGTVTFPAPSAYGGQQVVAFSVTAKPASALLSWRWMDRGDGLNRVCEARVRPVGKVTTVSLEALVLVPPHAALDRRGGDRWLSSTACVQSADPLIKAQAARLKAASTDREDLVYQTVQWVARNRLLEDIDFKSLDAKCGLLYGGSCTNHANLCAALLRANGIPARTVSHMPTWATVLYQHWLTEYWKPGEGWVMVEPTVGVFRPFRNTVVVLAVSSEADENRAFGELHERFSMPGSAYLSLAELSPELYMADVGEDDGFNTVSVVRRFPSSTSLMRSASSRAALVEKMARVGRATSGAVWVGGGG